ncbi:MAG: transcription-repair coupling factor [Clostridia bacterium]|nr:transcription-repair coupling factor [Clostridia bacterium]MDD4501545.1 transcription-repair coupling factor [Clostridia bacterium]HPB16187.1 transcription-repair coupling factor [Clostridia bacterium]HQM95706.1 transcription-repair coupling factor [Clostridia bacterium]
MNPFIQVFSDIPQQIGIADCIALKQTPVGLSGPGNSLCPLISYVTASMVSRKLLIITHSRTSALSIYQNLISLYGDDAVYIPIRELMLYDIDAYSGNDKQSRLRSLYRVATGKFKAAVACTEALTVGTVSREVFLESIINLKKGDQHDMESLGDMLSRLGYVRKALVEEYGQYSIRGGILDIFTCNYDNPVRFEFFGDEIDSIRFFDADSQRSVIEADDIVIIPYSEFILNKDEENMLKEKITDSWDLQQLSNNDFGKIMDRYYALTDKCQMTGQYFNKDILTVVHNDLRCHVVSDTVYNEYANACVNLLQKKKTFKDACEMQKDIYSLYSYLKPELVLIYEKSDYSIPLYRDFDIKFEEASSYKGDMEQFLNDVAEYRAANMRIFISSDRKKHTEYLKGFFEDNGYAVHIIQSNENHSILPRHIYIVEDGYNESFVSKEAKIACISVSRIFRKNAKGKTKQIRDTDFFAQIQPNDYVVHDHHGIGIYLGVEKIDIDGIIKDYIKIAYKNSDMLYVPVSKMDLVQKYVGTSDRIPRVTGLGGHDWEKQKSKVRKAVQDIAKELIELYSKRNSVKGHAFHEDTPWQISFENEFSYEETEDQIKCVEEIKNDMESTKVMDRLLCGDVGYGKTEVALRAVFKAVMDGKQVAFLAPTTMLALQHYNNFKERMRNYPISIDLMCRLRDKKKQKKTVEDIKNGKVDIVVGTHRILEKDVFYKDLGLLVVDEEQRFGVAQKEKIKMLKPTVDVLSLTATPIPRTMHMALSGIRDVSTIYDPPEKRFPIQTYVMEYDPEFIKEAILREKDRNGQIFYLYNRVMDMENKFHHLKTLLKDEVRICMAHGQMQEKEFENTIIKFINHEYDVLLCTTIIEAGIDISNANTLIIEDADKLGLAQLYQIKGRVGRSDKVAYAYITYKRGKELTEEASKRLQTIKEYTEFGSGIKIAMKDLEIRGGGDLLGANQSGHMQGVGYDMYVRILSEEIANLRGEKVRGAVVESSVDLNISAYIDKSYINDDLSRLKMYKRIALVGSAKEKEDIIDELIDRYNEPPVHVVNIIDVAYAKNLASKLGISDITQIKKGLVITYEQDSAVRFRELTDILDKERQKYMVKMQQDLRIRVDTHKKGEEMLAYITKILERALELK